MKLLIVEDDPIAAEVLAQNLESLGHQTQLARNGLEALASVAQDSFDVMVIDRMMPKMDGIEAIKQLRANHNTMPVLILSALGDVDERVEGLQAGGDDYLVKPYALRELVARLEVLVKRSQTVMSPILNDWIEVFDLRLNKVSGKVFRQEKRVLLQPQERKLLEYFALNPNQLITRNMLLEKVWDFHFDTDSNLIDTQISRLRTKVDKPFHPPLIHTIRGKGYVFSHTPDVLA
ncbi:response regulator transcription factor [Thiomicrorhabdus arctica]|uniref:response regulator transcription factor n=1 Tax=Thiomicrorhabdus arctica TaxID=131540 RepID=UPI0003705DA1|nr:response regulator transcription factor [Thiomicrorhabdus arctica]